MKTDTKTKKKKTVKGNKKEPQKKKINYKKRRIIALIILIVIILVAVVAILLSSNLFNIKKIMVVNNNKVTADEIIQSSGLAIDDNMFKSLGSTVKEKIKTNPYIEDVKITRKLDGTVIVDVTERTPTFSIKGEEEYFYINNQGYILEKTSSTDILPIIYGYSTTDVAVGQRLCKEDLKKLDSLIRNNEHSKKLRNGKYNYCNWYFR